MGRTSVKSSKKWAAFNEWTGRFQSKVIPHNSLYTRSTNSFCIILLLTSVITSVLQVLGFLNNIVVCRFVLRFQWFCISFLKTNVITILVILIFAIHILTKTSNLLKENADIEIPLTLIALFAVHSTLFSHMGNIQIYRNFPTIQLIWNSLDFDKAEWEFHTFYFQQQIQQIQQKRRHVWFIFVSCIQCASKYKVYCWGHFFDFGHTAQSLRTLATSLATSPTIIGQVTARDLQNLFMLLSKYLCCFYNMRYLLLEQISFGIWLGKVCWEFCWNLFMTTANHLQWFANLFSQGLVPVFNAWLGSVYACYVLCVGRTSDLQIHLARKYFHFPRLYNFSSTESR